MTKKITKKEAGKVWNRLFKTLEDYHNAIKEELENLDAEDIAELLKEVKGFLPHRGVPFTEYADKTFSTPKNSKKVLVSITTYTESYDGLRIPNTIEALDEFLRQLKQFKKKWNL